MAEESHHNHTESCSDPDCNHDHETEDDLQQQFEAARSDFIKQLKEDEETIRLVVDLASGKDEWDKLISSRVSMLYDILEWNNESVDPLLELYGAYLSEGADETMTQFNVLESRRLLMRDFFIIKTLIAKIGADVQNIDKRLSSIEQSLETIAAKMQ